MAHHLPLRVVLPVVVKVVVAAQLRATPLQVPAHLAQGTVAEVAGGVVYLLKSHRVQDQAALSALFGRVPLVNSRQHA